MRKAASLLLVSSLLLLTACEGVVNLEGITGWRERFTLGITPEQIQSYLGWIVGFFIALFAFRALTSLPRELDRGTPLRKSTGIWAVSMMIAFAMWYLLIPVANQITSVFLPPELTIDRVLENLHLLESLLNPANAILQVWATGLTVALPIFVSGLLLLDLFLVLYGLILNVLRKRSGSIWAIIGVWVGHALFLSLFVMTQEVLGQIYPTWTAVVAGAAVSAIYNFILAIFAFLCYLVLPMVIQHMAPEMVGPNAEYTENTGRTESGHQDRDWGAVIPLIFASGIGAGAQAALNSDDEPNPSSAQGGGRMVPVDVWYMGPPEYDLRGPVPPRGLPSGRNLDNPDDPDDSGDLPDGSPRDPGNPPQGGAPGPDWVPPMGDDVIEGVWEEVSDDRSPSDPPPASNLPSADRVGEVADAALAALGAAAAVTGHDGAAQAAQAASSLVDHKSRGEEQIQFGDPGQDPDFIPPLGG